MNRFLALITSGILLLSPVGIARADIREATYEIQGFCPTHTDPAFPDALGGLFSPDAVTNPRPHIHMNWLLADGVIASPEQMIGHCYVIFSQWTKGADGNMHQRAYIPKGEMSLREVTMHEALGFNDSIVDQYIEDQDVEMARRKGLGSSGSTPTHEGHRRGAE